MANLVVYASPSDKALAMAPDDVEVRYYYDDTVDDTPVTIDAVQTESKTGELASPEIAYDSFTTTIRTLADGSVVADVEFDIGEVVGADSYEVRYA